MEQRPVLHWEIVEQRPVLHLRSWNNAGQLYIWMSAVKQSSAVAEATSATRSGGENDDVQTMKEQE